MITFLDSKSFSPQEISTLQSCQQNHPKSRGHCVKPYQDYKTTTEHSSILSVTGQWVCRIWVGISIRYLGDKFLTQFPWRNILIKICCWIHIRIAKQYQIYQHEKQLTSTSQWCGIFGFFLLSLPQNETKIYKLRQLSLKVFWKSKHRWLYPQLRPTKLSQFVYFSLVLRERDKKKSRYLFRTLGCFGDFCPKSIWYKSHL